MILIPRQLYLERSCVGILPSISSPQRFSPKYGCSPSRFSVSGTTASAALGLIVCVLLFIVYGDMQLSSLKHWSQAPASASTVLGKRSWKDVDLTKSQRLEVQIAQKEEQIESLKRRLIEVQSTRLKTEVNMASQESVIKALQQRQEVEKAAKYKAMYAVAERTRSLEECTNQQQQLEQGLAVCQSDLVALRHASQRK
ncbi:hypothetical protein CEUSTIGMA_g10503.t1 [Chlamydomonas eustigma]|uniref:Uncharacterized protein n=1 Tax=Chlamydomonas eustigma TaxID=1157962 RepID=A0A250XJ27_9CHLO|nr:hypothetical protein CEUSTIGMA_g10503.t1 [Chlamydomonas eustigma]|eukprot:GAX83077.1 hypothetical protein CEUSTIGMA_g10503.t1 [Chlamydomonas eustigma]